MPTGSWSDPLLQLSGGTPQAKQCRSPRASAVLKIAGSSCGVSFALWCVWASTYRSGSTTKDSQVSIDRNSMLFSPSSTAANQTTKAMLAEVDDDLKCWPVPGGTCGFWRCRPERNSICASRRCICEGNLCAGADGRCHADRPIKIAESVLFRSVLNPSLTLHAKDPVINTGRWMWLEDDACGDCNRFNLYKLPQRTGKPERNDFILESVHFPGSLVYPKEHLAVDTQFAPSHLLAMTTSDHKIDHEITGVDFGAFSFYRVAGDEGVITMAARMDGLGSNLREAWVYDRGKELRPGVALYNLHDPGNEIQWKVEPHVAFWSELPKYCPTCR